MRSMKKIKMMALSLIIIGVILIGVGCGMGGQLINNKFGTYIGNGIFLGINFGELEDSKNMKLTQSFSYKDIDDLEISMDIGNVEVKYTDDEELKIDCMNVPKNHISQSQSRNKLEFEVAANSIFANPGPSYKIIVHIPNNMKFKSIDISSDVGKITADRLTASNLDIGTETGSMEIGELIGTSVQLSSDTGNQKIKKVTCDRLEVSNDTGAVTVDEADCKRLSVESDTGSVTINGVSATDIILDNDVGKIECGILGKEEDYGYEVENDIGKVDFGSKSFGFDSEERQSKRLGFIKVTNDVGSVSITFQ